MGSFALCTAEFAWSQLELWMLPVPMVWLPVLELAPGLLESRMLLVAAAWSHLAFLLVDPRSVLGLGLKPVSIPRSLRDRSPICVQEEGMARLGHISEVLL